MNSSNPYQSVSCAMHSELELAIMHGRHLKIHYVEADMKGGVTEKIMIIKPSDIITRGNNEKGEFLLGSDQSGKKTEIRLDKIKQFIIKK